MKGLRVRVVGGPAVVHDVSLSLEPGQILGIVGESGAGKTTTALALLGYALPGMEISAGTVAVGGEVLKLGNEQVSRRLRGRLIAYVPQDPRSALNPAMRVGDAVDEILRAHGRPSPAATARALERVELPTDPKFRRRYPHQLSGGQQQRLCIAIALSCDPSVVVLDEPTTGLDVITQSLIVDQLLRLKHEHGVSMVYVSHNLAVISELADSVAVMYAGRIVETGPTAAVVNSPLHPYTRGLIAAIPDHRRPGEVVGIDGQPAAAGDEGAGCAFAPRCEFATPDCEQEVPPLASIDDKRRVRCIHVDEIKNLTARQRRTRPDQRHGGRSAIVHVDHLSASYPQSRRTELRVIQDVSFAVDAGECVALVGESGSGKTTIARALVGLHAHVTGSIRILGEPIPEAVRQRSRRQRRMMQLISQNPQSALNPRQRVGDAIARSGIVLQGLGRPSAEKVAVGLLRDVRLPAAMADRYPGELSGGEVQRVALARALAAEPELLVCDEITSALDVSVQAVILELLAELRALRGLAILFVTHDLGVVSTIADRVLVLDRGVICEQGAVAAVLSAPKHPYTRRLLEAAPSLTESTGAS